MDIMNSVTAGRSAAATQIGWDRSDIIELAALIVSVPSAVAGCIAVAVCLTRRRRKRKTTTNTDIESHYINNIPPHGVMVGETLSKIETDCSSQGSVMLAGYQRSLAMPKVLAKQDGESVHKLSSNINEQMVKELAKWWQERYDKLSTEVAAEPCEWAEELRLMRTHNAEDTAIHQPAINSGEEIELEAMKSVD